MGAMSGPYVIRGSVSLPEAELMWRFSRSSGPGGQHVNTSDSQVGSASTSRRPSRSPRCGRSGRSSAWRAGSWAGCSRCAPPSTAPSGATARPLSYGSPRCSPRRRRRPAAAAQDQDPAGHQRTAAAREEAARRDQARPLQPRLVTVRPPEPTPVPGLRAPHPSCRYRPRKYVSGEPSPLGRAALSTRPITSVWSPATTRCSVRHSRVASAPPISGAAVTSPRV